MYRWSSERVAERALAVLHDTADHEGYVAATAASMAPRIHVSVATAGRALLRLAETGAVDIVRRGHRDSPTVYRLTRAVDPLVLRDVTAIGA